MAGSDVAKLLERITLSYQAAQRALTSPAIMAKHEFIQKRMEEIEIARDKITNLVGDEYKATDMVVSTLAMAEEKGDTRS